MVEALLTLDGAILLWIQENLRIQWLTPFVVLYTRLGGLGLLWIVLSVILLCFKKTRWAGLAGILGLICSLCLNNFLLKNLVARTRPYEVVDGLVLLTAKATDYSFPSGHAGSSFAAAVAICRTLKPGKAKWLLLLMAVLMALSRLYIGIHYPTDVLCGALTGTFCGFAAAWLIQSLKSRVTCGPAA